MIKVDVNIFWCNISNTYQHLNIAILWLCCADGGDDGYRYFRRRRSRMNFNNTRVVAHFYVACTQHLGLGLGALVASCLNSLCGGFRLAVYLIRCAFFVA